jgi:diacylglycerol kinase family enzyme
VTIPGVTPSEGRRAWMVFVGNGRYGTGLLDLIERADVTDPVLDLRVAWSERRFAKARLVAALATGRRADLDTVVVSGSLTMRTGRRPVTVTVDGDVVELGPLLTLTAASAWIDVVVPAGAG